MQPLLFMKHLSRRKPRGYWDRFEFIYTPKYESWLINMAEIEILRDCLNLVSKSREGLNVGRINTN